MAAAVEVWRANQAALAELALDPRELARRLELHEHQLAEISGAKLRVGEAADIKARLSSAQHAESIARGSTEIHELLAGEGSGAREAAAQAAHRARDLARVDARFEGVAERLLGLAAELEDAATEAASLSDSVDHDPAALAGTGGAPVADLLAGTQVRRGRGGRDRPRRTRGGGSGASAGPRVVARDSPGGGGAAAGRGGGCRRHPVGRQTQRGSAAGPGRGGGPGRARLPSDPLPGRR